MLTEADFERLRLLLRQDPSPGIQSRAEDRAAYNEALRKLVYVTETWIAEVQK
jgi:hypothetical protein